MTQDDKVAAVKAAIAEHAALYAALQAPATPAAYDAILAEGLHNGLTQKIAAIFVDKT
jgi:hypothetical protein